MSTPRRRVAAALALSCLLTSSLVAVIEPAYAAACTGVPSDFDNDGRRDVAIGDPNAAVGAANNAGAVTIVKGAPGGVGTGTAQVISQASPGVGGGAEEFDQFGWSIAVADVNGDNCADLVVGSPGETIGSTDQAGMAQIIWGSTRGLGAGAGSTDLTAATFGGSAREFEALGLAVDATGPVGSKPGFVAAGAPGGVVSGNIDAGWVGIYPAGGPGKRLHQDSSGVAGIAEAGDSFGYAVAIGRLIGSATGLDVAVGAPNEDLGTLDDTGSVTVLKDVVSGGSGGTAYDQSSSGVPGSPEAGDGFGTSLAAIRVGTMNRLAVGVPSEDLGSVYDAGSVQLFYSSAGTTLKPSASLSQDTAGVSGTAEVGDGFGETLRFAPPGGDDPSTWIGVGIPFEDGSESDIGQVQFFPIADLDAERSYTQDSTGIPGVAQHDEQFGHGLGFFADANERSFVVGIPYDIGNPRGMVVVIPLTGASLRFWAPGSGPVPLGGSEAFGYSSATGP